MSVSFTEFSHLFGFMRPDPGNSEIFLPPPIKVHVSRCEVLESRIEWEVGDFQDIFLVFWKDLYRFARTSYVNGYLK